VLAYEHASGRLLLCAADPGDEVACRYRTLGAGCGGWGIDPPPPTTPDTPHPTPRLQSTFSRPDYLRAVGRVLEYIAAGDIYQVNLSQRFSVPYAGGAALQREGPRRAGDDRGPGAQ
jgi:anthranilate/para-aminobenzoate synthase component I